MYRSRLPELIAARLGATADRPHVLAIADDVRREMGELSRLDQADPDALAGIIGRHEERAPGWWAPPVAGARQCPETCAYDGACPEQCFLPAGHDGGRHRCQEHFLVDV